MADNPHFLIRRGNGPWREPAARAYQNENQLQNMLLESPQLIPGLGPCSIVDEFYIRGFGSVDLVGIEPTGEITLVECKLAANPEIRRGVVAQILSYAAGVWQLTYDSFSDQFYRRAGEPMIDAVSKVAAEAGIEFNPDEFVRALTANLNGARFRLCIAVDEITEELKGIVELLNTQTKPGFELMLLELTHASDGDVQVLVPQTYGLETAQLKSGRDSRSTVWTTAEVLDTLGELCSPEGVHAVQELMQWAELHNATYWHGRGEYPTVSCYLHVNNENRSIFAVYADRSGPTAPRISLSFGAFSKSMPEADVRALATELTQTPELAAAGQAVLNGGFNKYPNIPIEASLAKPGVIEALLHAINVHLKPHLS